MIQTVNKFVAAVLTFALAGQPLPSPAHSYAQGDLVIAPDPAFVAAALQKSHEIFALEETGTLPPVPASEIAHSAAVPFVPFPLVDPKTGKALDPSANIVVHGQNGVQQTVNAQAYVNNINSLEKALNKTGASLRDTTPKTIVQSIGADPGAYGRDSALPQGTVISAQQLSSEAGSLAATTGGTGPTNLPGFALPPPGSPVPHLATIPPTQPKICVNSGAAQGILQQGTTANSSVLPQTSTPSPSPTPRRFAPIGTFRGFPAPTPSPTSSGNLHSALTPISITKNPVDTSTGGQLAANAAQQIAYEQLKCPQPVAPMPASVQQADLSSTLGINQNQPLTKTYGDKSLAAVSFNTDVTVTSSSTSGQPVPTLNANVTGQAYLFNKEQDFFDAKAHTGGASSGIDVTVAGDSVFSESFTNGDNTKDQKGPFTLFNFNVPIPIIDGITLNLSASLGGSVEAFYDLDISKTTLVDSLTISGAIALNGTFSASVDVSVYIADVSAGVQGQINFLTLTITAVGGLGIIMVDRTIGGASDHNPRDIRDCQLNLTYIDGVSSRGTALSGGISGYTQECVDYFFGSSCAKQSITLATWNGISLKGALGNPTWQNVPFGPHYTDGPEYGIPLTGSDVYSADNTKAEPAACAQFPVVYAN